MLCFLPACRAAAVAALPCLAASATPAQGKVADAPFDSTQEFAWGDAGLRYCGGEGAVPATLSFHLQSC